MLGIGPSDSFRISWKAILHPTPSQGATTVSSQLTGEHIPPRPQKSEATVSVKVCEDDLLGLQVLATVAGISESDSGSFAELLTSTLHLGVIDSYKTTGLTWPPNPAGFGVGKRFSVLGDKRADEAPSHRSDTQTLRNVALSAVAVAAIVVIVGSYAGHWSWTGLTQNGQVWDWMELLLLPVALGTFPLWLRFSGQMSSTRRKALGGAVLAFAGFVLAGYLVPLTWTGFRGHTLWNWLTLIVLPVTITTATVWPKTGRTFRPVYRDAAAVLCVAWIVTVIGGYAGGWAWTGYPGNTLWDWVKLLLAPIAISTRVVPELIKIVSGNIADVGQQREQQNAGNTR
jgi:hypothetical protein